MTVIVRNSSGRISHILTDIEFPVNANELYIFARIAAECDISISDIAQVEKYTGRLYHPKDIPVSLSTTKEEGWIT